MTIIVGIICLVVGILIGYLSFPIYVYMIAKLKNRSTTITTRYPCEIKLYDDAEIEED